VSRYQKGKTKLDFTEARDSEWQWHHLGRMQVCTLLQTDNHANTHRSVFLQAGCNIYKKWKRNEKNKPAVECAAEAAQRGKEIARRSDGEMLS